MLLIGSSFIGDLIAGLILFNIALLAIYFRERSCKMSDGDSGKMMNMKSKGIFEVIECFLKILSEKEECKMSSVEVTATVAVFGVFCWLRLMEKG